ncbi:MAG TPA: hypothetical protein VFR44_01620 [Actinomycetota bacterium]|nr:hypothetical protein [Actinomycetota bacterium]
MDRTSDRPSSPRAERAVAVLRRALTLASAVVDGLRWLAIAAVVAVAAAWLAAVAAAPPSDATDWVARVLVLGLLLVPSGVLLLFLLGIRALSEIPARYRELPADVRRQAAELGDLRTPARPRRGLIGSVVGLARLVLGSRDLLTPYAVIAAALRPAMLVAAVLAAIVAALEIPVAALVLVVAVLGSLAG